MPPKQINQQTNNRPFYKKKKNRQSKNVKLRKIQRAIEHQKKLRQQSEQVITIPSVEENEISPSDHNVNNERHLPSHQNKNLTIPVVTPYQPINDLPTSYSQANVGRRAIEHQKKLRQQSEQAVTIPSVEENEISPSDHNANNERHLPSHQNENLIPVVMPCQPIDDLPSYSQENVGRVVLSQNVDSQFTEFRCLSGYFHKDQEDLDRCYKNFIKKYGNSVDKFMDIYSCNRLEAEDFILKYSQLFL
ncbi:unnamed protein product [Rhizophagus irregularis]|nr:unnamed protein product [Rhizophagus irregularis]